MCQVCVVVTMNNKKHKTAPNLNKLLTLRLVLRGCKLFLSLSEVDPLSPAQDRENERPRDPPGTLDLALTRT